MWLYKGEDATTLEEFQFPTEYHGFIYRITHIPSGKQYIGKKNFRTERKKRLGKRRLAEYKAMNLPGRPPKYEMVVKESDWKTYLSSQKDFKELLKATDPSDIKKEILHLAHSKKELTYLEVKYQFLYNVLEDDTFINSNILGKFFKGEF